ncbi:MAG: hypothetical protein ACRDH8_02275 [Actinomycetota bacterium]
MDTAPVERARLPGWAVAVLVGAFWGLVGYALLWGHTPVVIHRSFVVSPLGTLALLPVRVVLWSIHAAEGLAGSPFDFSRNNAWIGALSGVAGAAIAVLSYALGRTTARLFSRSGPPGR